MHSKVLASVIVPMFNAEAFVLKALASIQQEHSISMEIIVVDDGSTDASLKKVQEIHDPRVRVIHLPEQQGIAAALNIGLDAARGEIVMRCDADDLYPPRRIAKQVNWLLKNPEFDAVCGNYKTIDYFGRNVITFRNSPKAEEVTHELRNGITRTHLCTFAIRAQALRELDGFRQYFCTSEDIDLQLRLGDKSRVWYLPDVLYCYRIHNSSITHTQSNLQRLFFEFKAREFQQQRQSRGCDDLQRGCPPVPPQTPADTAKTAAQHLHDLLIGSAWQEHAEGRKLHAIFAGARSLLAQPQNRSTWKSFLALILKPPGKSLPSPYKVSSQECRD